MKTKDVLRILNITRPTLTKYVKSGTIGVTELPNGRYDYNEQDVYKFLNKDCSRKTVIYARVSTNKQKKDLQNQVDMLKQFCFSNGYIINGIYFDVASGISFENRNDFFSLLDEVISGKVERVVITYKDRISRVGFELFKHLFLRFNTQIIVMSDIGSSKLDSEEIFEEIISLLHCYSMKLYSKRNQMKLKQIINDKDDVDETE
jgi:predicted site-specific integrase-resolvase